MFGDKISIPQQQMRFFPLMFLFGNQHTFFNTMLKGRQASDNNINHITHETEKKRLLKKPLKHAAHTTSPRTVFSSARNYFQLELVLFDDALRHLLRLNRLIEMPRGSALLVGVGGSGKQSLTRLASYISRAVCFQITLTKTYNVNSFMEDLRCGSVSCSEGRGGGSCVRTAAVRGRLLRIIPNKRQKNHDA